MFDVNLLSKVQREQQKIERDFIPSQKKSKKSLHSNKIEKDSSNKRNVSRYVWIILFITIFSVIGYYIITPYLVTTKHNANELELRIESTKAFEIISIYLLQNSIDYSLDKISITENRLSLIFTSNDQKQLAQLNNKLLVEVGKFGSIGGSRSNGYSLMLNVLASVKTDSVRVSDIFNVIKKELDSIDVKEDNNNLVFESISVYKILDIMLKVFEHGYQEQITILIEKSSENSFTLTLDRLL